MTQWFEQDLTTLAFCWRIERRDGVTLGFTSHDRDLVFQGLACRAAPGMVPSAIERSDGLEADDAMLSAALASGAFSETDLMAGRWDGAGLWLHAVNWLAPDTDPLMLLRGELGEVEIRDNEFSVGLRGPSAVLDAPVVENTSPTCRAELGDKRCRIDLAIRRTIAIISAANGAMLTMSAPLDDGDFAWGHARWLTGDNAGLEEQVMHNERSIVTLRDRPRRGVLAGDRIELTQGCDKRFVICSSRFQNALNFRGEPHLPGNDLLTRYGG
jgi:uncharacterized phage protein (TIGR02218 family)